MLQISRLLVVLLGLITTAACSHKDVRPSTPADIARIDNSYMDLEPGWKLRIVVPWLKSGGFRVAGPPAVEKNGTLSISSEDVIGYRVFQYLVIGRKDGVVRLKFLIGSIKG